MKIIGSEIQRNGETIRIELGDLPKDLKDFKYVWLQAENLPALAEMSEHL